MSNPDPFSNSGSSQTNPPQSKENSLQRLIPGIVLIVLGIVFFAGNFANFTLHNWWALFILIPAVGAFARAYDRYKQAGRLDEHARQALLGGIILTAIVAIFLFELSWTLFGPVILILIGLSLLGREWLR
jgi:hypothetical protein